MGEHIKEGKFQSDKYPSCPAGKVPLSTADPMAQDLLWEYAERRSRVDKEFSEDVQTCLMLEGYKHDDASNGEVDRLRIELAAALAKIAELQDESNR